MDHPPGCRCGHHVYTAVVGHGLRVIPRAPFRAWLGPDGALDVEHDAAGGTVFARVIADGAGGYRFELGAGEYELASVLDVAAGLDGDWRLDARTLRCPLPAGFRLHSVEGGSSSPFDLVGPCDSLLYVQEPANLPGLDRMTGPGQREERRGATWIELRYDHGGRPWWQRHEVVRRDGRGLVFTAQAPGSHRELARDALTALVAELELA